MRKFYNIIINQRNKSIVFNIHWRSLTTAITDDNVNKDWNCGDNTEVLFQNYGDTGLITLNRPHILNSINRPMCKRILDVLTEWEFHKKLVVIEGAGDKAFCTGGDLNLIRYITEPNSYLYVQKLFVGYYKLFSLIAKYKIPYVALMNNITMGAGAGLCLQSKYKVVTEKSIFAMPETSVGYYPDGGCTYFLPRLKDYVGYYMGLTGYPLKGADILRMGLCTHYVPSDKLPHLKYDLLTSNVTDVNEVLCKYHTDDSEKCRLEPYISQINHCFSAPTVEEIVERLEADGTEWAQKTLKILNDMSPTALKITHYAFEKGKSLDYFNCLKMECKLSCSFSREDNDFAEGMGAKVVKGRKPIWKPKSLKDVSAESIAQRFKLLYLDTELKM